MHTLNKTALLAVAVSALLTASVPALAADKAPAPPAPPAAAAPAPADPAADPRAPRGFDGAAPVAPDDYYGYDYGYGRGYGYGYGPGSGPAPRHYVPGRGYHDGYGYMNCPRYNDFSRMFSDERYAKDVQDIDKLEDMLFVETSVLRGLQRDGADATQVRKQAQLVVDLRNRVNSAYNTLMQKYFKDNGYDAAPGYYRHHGDAPRHHRGWGFHHWW